MKYLILLLTITWCSFGFSKSVPTLSAPVMDEAGMLSQKTKNELNKSIYEYRKNKGAQITVLTVASLEGEDVFQYSQKVFETWKLGNAKKDDGLLILFALKERKSRIHTGQGLEGYVTDAHSIRILDSLKPALKSQNYDQAVTSAVAQVMALINKGLAEDSPLPTTTNNPVTKVAETYTPIKQVYEKDENSDFGLNFATGFSGVIVVTFFFILMGAMGQQNTSLVEAIDKQNVQYNELLLNNQMVKTESGTFLVKLDTQLEAMSSKDMFVTLNQVEENNKLKRKLQSIENECANYSTQIKKYRKNV